VVGAGALNGYMEKQTNKKLAQQVGKERLNFGVEELKKMNDKAIELLKQQKKNPRLAKLQLDNINKSIKRFEKTFAKVGSSDLDVFKAYQEVSFRIPSKTLEGIAVLDTKIL
jgi:Zn-dependent M16 (insulinase) family peptidase